jgi:TonB family protein
MSFVPPLAASALVHLAAIAMVGGHGASRAQRIESRAPLLWVEVEGQAPADARAIEASEPTARIQPSRAPHSRAHHHAYPVPTGHDASPHDPNWVHLPEPEGALGPAEDAVELPAQGDEPLHFNLPRGQVHGTGHWASGPVTSAPSDSSSRVPYLENEISVKARLLTSAPASYPVEALRAEVEADVPLEIVVDERGRVTSARALETPGYGLEQAALAAVLGYRFSAAERQGRPVRVRMRWVVQFRLH